MAATPCGCPAPKWASRSAPRCRAWPLLSWACHPRRCICNCPAPAPSPACAPPWAAPACRTLPCPGPRLRHAARGPGARPDHGHAGRARHCAQRAAQPAAAHGGHQRNCGGTGPAARPRHRPAAVCGRHAPARPALWPCAARTRIGRNHLAPQGVGRNSRPRRPGLRSRGAAPAPRANGQPGPGHRGAHPLGARPHRDRPGRAVAGGTWQRVRAGGHRRAHRHRHPPAPGPAAAPPAQG